MKPEGNLHARRQRLAVRREAGRQDGPEVLAAIV
jgi:hypothetical protein